MTDLHPFGMIGLGVMGSNLAHNIADHGYTLALWNLERDWTDRVVAERPKSFQATDDLASFVAALAPPRKMMIMIKAGKPVDMVLDKLVSHLDSGDIVIDGGNSNYQDTRRRQAMLARHGIHFFGVGVSGGAEGARHGPSLMPGGDQVAYLHIQPILEAIAAKTEYGACVTHIGPDGAGHFVKMVHNGIEYADMQILAEAYDVMKRVLGLKIPEIAQTFTTWNQGPLASYLVEITAKIFERPSPEGWLVEQVLDRAGQKGTGRWTAQVALELGVSIPSIAAAIDARVISSQKAFRQASASLFKSPEGAKVPKSAMTDLHDALHAAKIMAYAQGLSLIRAAGDAYNWPIDLKEVARIWTGGCIIRAQLLTDIMRAYADTPDLTNLLLDDEIRARVHAAQAGWRRTVALATSHGIPIPAIASSLAWFDGLRTANLPQNLTQAQRDAFGAHTYRTKSDPDGPPVHTDWLES